MMPAAFPGYMAYWGKAKPEGGCALAFHRLAYHSLDVAACARVFLERDGVLGRRLEAAAAIDRKTLETLVVYLAALHDAGKFAPSFQLLVPEVALQLRADLAHVDERLKLYVQRHDSMGFRVLDELWPALCERGILRVSDAAGAEQPQDESQLVLAPWVAAMTGHHGKPPDLRGGRCFDEQSKLDLVEFAVDVGAVVGLPVVDLPDLESAELAMKRSSWLIAGLAVVADWVGSNQRWFPYQVDVEPLAAYWQKAIVRAEKAVAEAGLLPCQPRPFVSFADSFPGLPDASPLQQHVAACPLAEGPQLFVIEESTGAGKTEAALVLARRLMSAGQADGIYVALPTMATANGMYERVKAIYSQLFEAAGDPSLVLAHSATVVHRLLAEQQRLDAPYSHAGNEDEETASLQCARWLSDSRKKAMLAHVGVGTIDQALLGVLPAKHSPVRLLGLHRKVLIVDEVHAYDAYVSRLLERLLEFHAAFGGSAVLLSATLPLAHRAGFCAAFLRGLGGSSSRGGTPTEAEFPLLTHLSSEKIVEQPTEHRPATERDVEVRFLETAEQALARLSGCVEQGRCAVWIRNTIADAVQAYDAAIERFGRDRVTLFHGRFALGDRIRHENAVLRAFGKNGGPDDRAGRVVIATQVVEQSLDLDFDEMISDLAPIDLLVQRAGRLCRHPRARDGTRTDVDQRGRPVMHVVAPPWAESPSADWLASSDIARTRFIYPHLGHLWLTVRTLRQLGAVKTPIDARCLVESVYGGMNRPPRRERVPVERVPHDGGDEPSITALQAGRCCVFPTTVGMNRVLERQLADGPRVPHDGGDEPPSKVRWES